MAAGAGQLVVGQPPMNIASYVNVSVASDALQRPDWTKSSCRGLTEMWLDKNENIDPQLSQIVMTAYHSVGEESLYGYPDTSGLYKKLANYIGVRAENLLLAHGSDGVIRSVFEAFIGVGDRVLISSPSFVMYEIYAQIYGASLTKVEYQPSRAGPFLDVEQFLAAIRKHDPKLVCLPNPDSPTGTVFSREDLKCIIDLCAQQNVLVLIDEAYHPFCEVTALPWIEDYSNLVVARTFAKAWGLAGLRIGYAVGSGEIISYLHKVRPMYEVNSVAVAVVEKMLKKADEVIASVRRHQQGMRHFLSEMSSMGFQVLEGAGNFSHVCFGSRLEEINHKLNHNVLYKKSFDHPSLSGYSRFSSAPVEQMEKIIELIR